MTPRAYVLLRNLALTGVYVALCWHFSNRGNNEAATMALAALGSVWLHSGRQRPPRDGSLSPSIPLLCLAFLALGACDYEGPHVATHWPYEHRVSQPDPIARVRLEYDAQAGLLADLLEMKPAAAPTCTVGRGCLYLNSADNLFYTKDSAELTLKLHAASSFRTAADCTALAAPANGDVCYSTGLGVPQFYAGGWTVTPIDTLVVHLAGIETITGVKTFNAAPVFGAGLTASGAVANNFSGSTGTFLTSSGANTLSGTTTLAANKNLLMTAGTGQADFSNGSGVFKTTTGAVTIGPGAVGISGNVTLTTTKTLLAGANTLIGSVADKLNAAMLAIASQAAGDLLVADTTTTFARLAKGSDGTVLTMASGAVTWATPTSVIGTIYAGMTSTSTLGAATTNYLGPAGTTNTSATQISLGTATRAGTLGHLVVAMKTAPGGADTVIWTVQTSTDQGATWSNSTLTCTITGAAKTCTDTSHTPSTALYDWVALKYVSSANVAAGPITAGMEAN